MGKTHRRYEEEYKREAVRFVEETDQPLAAVARELGVAPATLWRWRKRYGRGPQEVLSPDEAAELQRLRRENDLLRQERDFLKKATAYFAKPSR
jgi:transposase